MRLRSTLDQWKVLEVIVQTGGYDRAARALHMSQSTVSYAMARLQEALGVPLIQIEGRKAHLTEAGAELLQQVRPLLKGFSIVEAQAGLLAQGKATEITLATDSAYPDEFLFPALRSFQRKHRTVRLSVRQSIRLTVEAAHERHNAELCIIMQPSPQHPSESLYDVELVAVAHRSHPLHKQGEGLTLQQLAEHVLVQITEAEAEAPLQTQIEGCETWTMNTIPAALSAVRHGVCFGWLPKSLIEEDLQTGELKLLPLLSGARRVSHLFLSLRNDLPANSPAYALAREIRFAVRHP
jgi:DNA-binding transcriptional LysR family regulator